MSNAPAAMRLPLRVAPTKVGYDLVDADGEICAEAFFGEDAERIAASVNACADLPVERVRASMVHPAFIAAPAWLDELCAHPDVNERLCAPVSIQRANGTTWLVASNVHAFLALEHPAPGKLNAPEGFAAGVDALLGAKPIDVAAVEIKELKAFAGSPAREVCKTCDGLRHAMHYCSRCGFLHQETCPACDGLGGHPPGGRLGLVAGVLVDLWWLARLLQHVPREVVNIAHSYTANGQVLMVDGSGWSVRLMALRRSGEDEAVPEFETRVGGAA